MVWGRRLIAADRASTFIRIALKASDSPPAAFVVVGRTLVLMRGESTLGIVVAGNLAGALSESALTSEAVDQIVARDISDSA